MKFVQKFMQIGRSKTHFQQLNAEPRPAGNSSFFFPGGPPPSYRSSTNADDSATFSSTESSTVPTTTYSIKRRNSWINLIESNENLYKKDLLHYTESLCTAAAAAPSLSTPSAPPTTTTTSTTRCANVMMPVCCTWVGDIYENNYQFLEKYNLNGRYAKHFTPFYVLNSAGDPIAISKLKLTNSGSLCKLNGGGKKLPAGFSKPDRISGLMRWFQVPKNKFHIFIPLFLIIACCFIAAILLLSKQFAQESRNFSWIPPFIFRNQQGNSTVVKMYQNGHQVRFEILGNLPIKNNYIAVYDFASRRIAIIDSTLRDNGKNLVCFVMNMNISTMPDKYSLEIGAQNALKRKEQIHGWEEAWNFLPGSYFGNLSTLFDPLIPECDTARWILLNYTRFDQRGKKCSDCYDFCLPELGIEMDHLRAEAFLNIIRRNCFYLFVPEWRSFAAAYSGKQNEYDLEQLYYGGRSHVNNGNDNRSTNSSAGDNYGNRLNGIQSVIDEIVQPITDQSRNFESKWISLQEIPRNNYSGSMSSSTYGNFNLNSNSNEFETGNGAFSNNNDRMKPLLPMPPPSYPIQVKQKSSLDLGNLFTEVLQPYQNLGGANARLQNGVFGSNNEQFASPTKYSEQPNSYNVQLPSGQAFNGLSNTVVSIDGKNNQPKSIYDQSIMDGESNSKQSNYYTSQSGINVYMQQAANPKQNDQVKFFSRIYVELC
ncbi:CBR-PQN-73 protein, variant [Loa loa]|uniref:CBR-PQN-73 protein, variant n=1 Tax=Loa loa TaxID=7209 RepID=A0A1S0UM11_LOALO|nr:CBR-PQN-73 protein, variant [Loa loa]EJD76619.1 CBR-PQN-73 protein, variant [Loa loa]